MERYVFLISDQFEKGTLQAMEVFIRVASEMCNKILTNKRVEENNQ